MTAFLVALAGLLGALGGTMATVGVKWLNRDVDKADAMGRKVEALGGIIDDLVASDERKTRALDGALDRIALLEERERHNLTRQAVHEAWDQIALSILIQHNPAHPPPPPLTPPEVERRRDTYE